MSQFIVSARKYRPQRFDEVVGQDHVTTTLKNAIRQNKVAHAFLFCGPRGVGKTTSARILAKTINCENITEDYEACGQCDSCVAFQKKNAPNIIELDAASHNSVDDIRNLNEQVRIPPAQGNYKLFIIDEVHMLSLAAFNAFLKTLEEPPPTAIFILATTEKHKILPTILSRCQIYDFKRNNVSDIVAHLESICRAENLEFDVEALHLIAEKADGALRDALSIFDRMVSFSDGHISYASVVDQLNVLDHDYFFKLVDYLIAGDLSATYLLFDQILDKGFSIEVFLLGLQEHLRQLLMLHLSDTAGLINSSTQLKQRYASQSAVAPRDFLLTLLDLANECDIHYRFAQNKRLHVEIALMKMAYFPYAKDLSSTSLLDVNVGQITEEVKKNDKPEIREAGAVREPKVEAEAEEEEKTEADVIAEPRSEINEEFETKVEEETEVEGERESAVGMEAEVDTEVGDEKKMEEMPNPAGVEQKTEPGDVKPRRRSKSLLPTLNDVNEIIEEVQQTSTDQVPIPDGKELLHIIQKAWDDYTDNHSSPSLAAFMKDSKLDWREDKLYVTVTSKLARSSILDQRDLFEALRDATNPLVPEIVFEIDSQAPGAPPPPKILTIKDKYEALQQANPNLKRLIQELNLKIDEA